MAFQVNRRTVLKTAALGTLGVPAMSGVAGAWDRVEIDLECKTCEELGKLELTDQTDPTSFEIEEDWGVGTGVKTGPTTFEFDVGTGHPITIELTNFYWKDGEVIGFDFVVNGGGLCRVDVKDGGKDENEYRDLGTVVYGTEFFAPNNPTGNQGAVSNIQFYYCAKVKVCILSGENGFNPVETIDVTSDTARFGIWWEARHRKDEEVFDNGTAPSNIFVHDFDDDGVDDLCFKFGLGDAFIDDPSEVAGPDRMVAELLIQNHESGDFWAGETSEGLAALSPTPE